MCVWEILTKGMKPYTALRDIDVVYAVDSGEHLPKPSQCPSKLYNLLNLCWERNPENRPRFKNIKEIV